MSRRRIPVEFEDASLFSRKKRKMMISLPSNSTIGDLSHEIATTLEVDVGQLGLFTMQDFELRLKDDLDTIMDGEIVHAKRLADKGISSSSGTTTGDEDVPMVDINPDPISEHVSIVPEEDIQSPRVRIDFVTAELARKYAKATPKEISVPSNGVAAFNGKVMFKERLLVYSSSMPTESHSNCLPAITWRRGTAVASSLKSLTREVHSKRFIVDFLSTANLVGIMVVHTRTLRFRCQIDLHHTAQSVVMHWPFLVPIACSKRRELGTGPNLMLGVTTCITLIALDQEKVHREPTEFNAQEPHLTLVWSGDRVEKIPILKAASGNFITLSTDEVISIVQAFLTENDSRVPGLSLRIYSRDPVAEEVKFVKSTLLSICSTSTHTNQNYRRFELFPELAKGKGSMTLAGPQSQPSFSVDLHTSECSIVACNCSTLRELFPRVATEKKSNLLFFVVKRANGKSEAESSRRITATREATYVATPAWQPSTEQSRRGMAALLSSLYMFSHAVSQMGVTTECMVLSVVQTICRFPPAVRAMAILMKNKTLPMEERAALAETLYHAARAFSVEGPRPIVDNLTRTFETLRILLAHVLSIAATAATAIGAVSQPLTEEVVLFCSLSKRRISEPMIMDSTVVQRNIAAYRQPGGHLYRPNESHSISDVVNHAFVLQILAQSKGSSLQSVLTLRVENIPLLPPTSSFTLETLGRDFTALINVANETGLVTRGPLELKSPNVVAPQIVLDQEGLLAVFTGRGCGSTRDVNFFRPMNGGDTEVDVNDVGALLEPISVQRKAEKTWEIDEFGRIAALAREPDEAVVLCLDLSQSMNSKSSVHRRTTGAHSDEVDLDLEAVKLVSQISDTLEQDVILNCAKSYVERQHITTRLAWRKMSGGDGATADLLDELAILVRRDALITWSSHPRLSTARDDLDDVKELACFVAACTKHGDAFQDVFSDVLAPLGSPDAVVLGNAPYDVPAHLIDPTTGDLLTDPVRSSNVNAHLFINEMSNTRGWFESSDVLPNVFPGNDTLTSPAAVTRAVDEWVSGAALLRNLSTSETDDDYIVLTLIHNEEEKLWRLKPSTTVKALYSLVNRALKARYSSFTIRCARTNASIHCSDQQTIAATDLSNGGVLTIFGARCHTRQPCKVYLDWKSDLWNGGDDDNSIIILPSDAPIIALLSCMRNFRGVHMPDHLLWHGLTESGDGVRSGDAVGYHDWVIEGQMKAKLESRDLTRLVLLKELFNVFVNRLCSFDTKTSIVLGLITFSDTAVVAQELTPLFERFRRELERVHAVGDTAVYDALDKARLMLSQYRPDLPNLRKRIIIVSDGEDTSSESQPFDVCLALRRCKIIVDSVQVGAWHDSILHAISVATGGYRFFPNTSLGDALSIFDLETMLSSAERPARPVNHAFLSMPPFGDTFRYPIDIITADQFPQRADHLRLKEHVEPASLTAVKPSSGGTDRMKRIMQEIKALVADPHPNIDVYVNDQDISFFKVILEAPNKDAEKCPYRGGCFLLTCDIPEGYPRDPPEIRFVTFIMHPNVSKQGKVCVAELGRLWSSDITLKEIFSLIYGLLLEPDLENPLEIQASLKYYDDDGTYALAVADAVTAHALKTREEWKNELGDDD
ncbi:hypothetical protein GGX14DRAFT_583780 [Mycena pura]|uniref:UBC core domain-containing protein n=1 Tax=Mycena pura TaxID=153505 RepID=A0AAD6YVG8_9AGAR|nr:hypothetical protein GGX14DRAFT_583780 [Mycena pura]